MAWLELAPQVAILAPCPEPRPIDDSDQHDRGDYGDDEAQDVELEDAAGAEEARDASADERPDDPEQEGHTNADPLAARQQQAREDSDDESDQNEPEQLHAGPVPGTPPFTPLG